MDTVKIREVTANDAETLSNIYEYYVKNTAITFEYDPPSADEFRTRIKKITADYPYICAEKDGKILGYAYASRFRPRAAFLYCAEVSIYIDKSVRKSGIGRMLYEELEKRLKAQGILNLYALIAYPTDRYGEDIHIDTNSYDFHEHMGYVKNAVFHKCGYKFGCWYDLVSMEKMLGNHKL